MRKNNSNKGFSSSFL